MSRGALAASAESSQASAPSPFTPLIPAKERRDPGMKTLKPYPSTRRGGLRRLGGSYNERLMSASYDVAAIGNAIVDVIAPADEAFLVGNALTKGSMLLIDEPRAHELYGRMAPGMEASGGSAGNTVAGVASLGGRAAYVGKVDAFKRQFQRLAAEDGE